MSDKSLSGLAITATLSSASTYLIEAPFDRIKLLLQLQPGISQIYPNNRYQGIFNCIIRVYREQGFLSYWRGVTPGILGKMIKNLWMFSTKDFINAKLHRHNWTGKSFIIGGLSGMSHLIVTYPFNVLRTKLAVDVGGSLTEREYKGMNDCASKIWKIDGIRGFYRGVWLSFPGVFIYRGMYFGLYSTIKQFIDHKNFALSFLLAQFTTTVSSLTAYPIDTVMKRMMMQSGKNFDLENNIQKHQEERFKNSIDCANKMLRKEGLKSFFGGWWFNFIRSIGGALLLVGYDMIITQR